MSEPRELALIKDQEVREPAIELAIARDLLSSVSDGRRGPTVRVYRPSPTVALGRRDALLSGFDRAVAAAVAHGFTPVVRLQGGRAAAYHEGCLVLDEVLPAQDAMTGVQERFAEVAARQARALRGLGVDARVGEVPGEYCPGAFTVNAAGRRKLVGAAQRIVRGGWLLSSVVVVRGAASLRSVLVDVYGALGLEWDPATVGAVEDEAPGVGVEAVERALLDAYEVSFVDAELDPGRVAAAAAAAGRYRAG